MTENTVSSTYTVRLALAKTPQDNPYYYSNERLGRCMAAAEALISGAPALGVTVLAVTRLTGGYRVDCEDSCRVELAVKTGKPVSAESLVASLSPLASGYGAAVTVAGEGE